MKLRKFLTRNPIIDFLRCLRIPEMKIKDYDWNDLLSHWNAPEYRSKCAQAKKNEHLKKGGCIQRSVIDLHTLMRYFNILIYERILEDFEVRLSQVRSDATSIARLKHKGHLYGTGDLAHSYKCGYDSFMQHVQGSCSRAQDSTKINRLREELCQSKEEICVFYSIVL
ncbi:hypothetical protein GmHk_12G035243 [Glycine max]|nr:hypothetical protein GmHk_12G035243 [Glycine max]